MKHAHFIMALVLLLIIPAAHAKKSSTETAGDVLQLMIPLSGYAATFYVGDTEGRNQFYKSFLATFLITHALKITIKEKRPSNNGNQSFPSGHTSSAFQGAAFIQRRYGWRYGMFAYTAAAFTGYSRIEDESKKHYLDDVIAGAAIGILSSYYFTTPYNNSTLTPYASHDGIGINLSLLW